MRNKPYFGVEVYYFNFKQIKLTTRKPGQPRNGLWKWRTACCTGKARWQPRAPVEGPARLCAPGELHLAGGGIVVLFQEKVYFLFDSNKQLINKTI